MTIDLSPVDAGQKRAGQGGGAPGLSAPGTWQRISLRNFAAPFLAVLGAQLLLQAGGATRAWGWAVVAGSVVLLVLRLRSDVPGRWADALQIALAFTLSLQLSLNLDQVKQRLAPGEQILVWALSSSLVILTVLNFRPRRIELHLPPFRLDKWDGLAIGLLLSAAALTRIPSLDRIPLGFDPDEGSFATFAWDAASGAARDPFSTGWATHPDPAILP